MYPGTLQLWKRIWARDMLEVKNLIVSHSGVRALRDVCLSVLDSEIVTVIGANGGGKTTLLKAISGLLRPSSGSIEFLGERIEGLVPHEICRRGLIQVPEGRQLFPRMTVIDNLRMGAYLAEARRERAESLEKVFQLFPLFKQRRAQKAGLLSGGEQQMLAIGRALMSRPKLMMLDEPSEGLSPVLASSIFETLGTLGGRGMPILLVSQSVSLALELSKRTYVLENGQITLRGRSADLLNDDKVRVSYLGM
jgi:branched-chain amino acid transport system ATP-binding protein